MKSFFLFTLLSSFTSFSAQAEVNMKDASYFKTWIDIEIRKDAHIFQLRRTYNSRSLHPGLFGFGWCSDFEKRLDLSRSDQISLQDCRLSAPIRYKKKKEHLYESPEKEIKETLEFKDNSYLRTTAKNTLQKYDKLGNLTSLIDVTGNRLDIKYNSSGHLHKISFNQDIDLQVKFDPTNRFIQSITPGKGPEVSYSYKAKNLVHVTNFWKNSFRYHYDDFHNLIQVLYPDRTQEVLSYDIEKDWIVSLVNRHKCIESFRFLRQGNSSNYTSSAEKRCAGKSIIKTVYEFRHKRRYNGSKYLDQVKLTQGNQNQRITYQNTQGPLNDSP